MLTMRVLESTYPFFLLISCLQYAELRENNRVLNYNSNKSILVTLNYCTYPKEFSATST